MPRLTVRKGNLDRGDKLRALRTDTTPEETPIVVSNDGYHANLVRTLRHGSASPQLEAIVRSMVADNEERYTIPYRYRVRLSPTASRQLSLLHPAAQMKVAEFYGAFGHVVPYFCRHGSISLRRPSKIGSSVSFKTKFSGAKQHKRSPIDTLSDDLSVRNPGSFFAYAGSHRFYQFFNSNEFLALESRFALMRQTDISKCFSSMYSHTLAWAVKDVEHGKESVGALTFANEFDRLMQFANYNETNGIPVGPEFSRIFAEIILQSADVALLRAARQAGLYWGRDFEVRRYIDDYVIFANSTDVADTLQRGLVEVLGTFNLHLNDAKTRTVSRPLQTARSGTIVRANRALQDFASILSERQDAWLEPLPKRVKSGDAVFRTLVNDIKAACFETGGDYGDVAPYTVGFLTNLVDRLIEGRRLVKVDREERRRMYMGVFEVLLRSLFYFLRVHMTVRSSYQVAQATILSLRFFRRHLPEYWASIQNLVRVLVQGVLDDSALATMPMSDFVPIESLNILLAAKDLDTQHRVDPSGVANRVLDLRTIDYFSYVTILFYFEGNDATITQRVQSRLSADFLPRANPKTNSRDAHLLVDLISCPYLSQDFRLAALRALETGLRLQPSLQQPAINVIAEAQGHPWFTNWAEVDLLNHLRKKELAAVY